MPIDFGYPMARPRQATPPVGVAVAANPAVRLWPFAWREVNGVAVVVSPQFVGPAIIDALVFQMDTGSPGVFPTLTMYYANDSGGGGNNFAIGTIPTGTRIFENLVTQRDDAFGFTDLLGVPHFNIAGTSGWHQWPVKYLVNLNSFFLKIRAANNDGAAIDAGQGYVRVLEAVPPEQVPNFL